MQIRATVKWRQSLPLTRAAANHPRAHHPQSTGPRGCFSFSLTVGSHPLSPPSSRSSTSRAPDFHTPAAPATASPHQVERVEIRNPPAGSALSSNASAPGCTTRYIYIYIYASRFHWKIPLPLEEPHHAHRFTRDASRTPRRRSSSPSSSSSPGMPPGVPRYPWQLRRY